ncbi:unnamed protein product [Rhodiola kirilowii]
MNKQLFIFILIASVFAVCLSHADTDVHNCNMFPNCVRPRCKTFCDNAYKLPYKRAECLSAGICCCF